MAFPEVVQRSGGTNDSNSRTLNVTLPTGTTAGNLVLAVVGIDGDASVSTTSAGWTVLDYLRSGDGILVLLAAIAGESSTSLVLDLSDSESHANNTFEISGWSGRIADISFAFNGGDSAQADPPELIAPAGVADYLWIAAMSSGHGRARASAPPPGFGNYTMRYSGTASSSGNVATAELASTTDTVNPGPFPMLDDREWAAATLAIPPGAGTGPDPAPPRRGQFLPLFGR